MTTAATALREAALHLLLEQPKVTPEVKVERTTVAQRKDALALAIQDFDLDRLIALQDKAAKIIDQITANELQLGEDNLIPPALAKALMQEFLDSREVAELIQERREHQIKKAVFAHLTAQAELLGQEDPENQNGRLEVPELGYAFTREGCGQKVPTVNETRLRALLGEEGWASVCDAKEIPAHIEYTFSPEKVIQQAAGNPALLELVRSCLESAGWKAPRFSVRIL